MDDDKGNLTLLSSFLTFYLLSVLIHAKVKLAKLNITFVIFAAES